MYYLDENMVRMVQPPSSQPTVPSTPVNTVAKNSEKRAPLSSNKSGNKSGNKSVSPVLPVAMDRINDVESVEPKALANAEQTQQRVVMDSEPPTPTFKANLKPVSGGVLNGTAISLPTPQYPDAAKRMRISGLVSVSVVVDEMGKVISAQANSGPVPLREAATQAALRARFSPTKLSGQPVKVSGMINYKFALAQ
jgi:TonB family protein